MIKLVNELLMEAVKLQTSDVHIEPQENGMRVRFRLDGMLRISPLLLKLPSSTTPL